MVRVEVKRNVWVYGAIYATSVGADNPIFPSQELEWIVV